WERVPFIEPAAVATTCTHFHPTRQLGLSYWHSSNRTEKTAFLLRCFCRRKVACAVLVADEVNFEPIAGSPAGYRHYWEPRRLKAPSGALPAKGTTGSPAGYRRYREPAGYRRYRKP